MSSRSRRSGRSFSSFSSRSMGSYFIPKASYGPTQAAPIKAVTVNQNLLVPVKVDIDPTVRAVRYQEKEQIKSLNNRFASFIDKVRNLEQQNKMLETKWKLLQQETATPSQVKPMLEAYIANLQRQLDLITKDKSRLDMENSTVYKNLNDYRTKYEQEINKRNVAENEFVKLKKEVDASYVSKVELEDLVSGLSEEIMFLTAIYDAELRELQENLRGTSVVVQMDNSRALNMEKIVSEVKDQYEEIAARSREEAENWHRTKFEQMKAEANHYGEGFCNPKYEISKLKQKINRLQIEIETSKSQLLPLETQIAEAEQLGDTTVKDAKACIVDLEKNLQRAKVQMAQQIRDYQELMNVKLALDIEISTYKKLLEGEERRHEQNSISNKTFLNVKAAATKDISGYYQQRRQNAVFIKTVETNHTYRANM